VIALGRVVVTELDHGATPVIGNNVVDIGFDNSWNMAANPGSTFWDGFDFKNLSTSLANNGVVFTQGVTAFDFILDNQLFAFSEVGTLSFIDKKRIEFNVSTAPKASIPEPGSMLMSLVAMGGILCPRRRRVA
jgi:hypothetical protein